MSPWPQLVELGIGETIGVVLGEREYKVALRGVEHLWEPDGWIEGNVDRRTLSDAKVVLEVDGEPVTLRHRPYELPHVVGDLQIYVETTRLWATACAFDPLPIQKDVRLSIQRDGWPWGPASLQFAIRDYRWRASSYNNTWSALVPYNLLYYHRGEDYGAIPDELPVIAIVDGTVVASPVPTVRGSNSVVLRGDDGLTVHYAHMNIETITPDLAIGTRVGAGEVLGKTGCTWNGRRSQWADPHLHVGFSRALPNGEIPISPYPFLVGAYMRTYPDAVLPVAGGYHFTVPGRPVVLDASRTVIRAGERIRDVEWVCHDGTVRTGQVIDLVYDSPGQYVETLVVRTASGHEARDYAHVRVYNPNAEPAGHETTAMPEPRRELAYGWVYASPVRGLVTGEPVTIWNRLVGTGGPFLSANVPGSAGAHSGGAVAGQAAATVDYGDGSVVASIGDAADHCYAAPGLYTVHVRGQGADGEPVMAALCVVVSAG